MGWRTRAVARVLTWAALYVVAGYLGRATIIDGQALSLVWPAAGVAALWLVTGDRRTWPWDCAVLAVATFVVNFSTGAPPDLALVFVVTNLVQAWGFLLLMRRLAPTLWGFGGTRRLSRLADLGAVIGASACACLVAATVGHVGLRLTIDAGSLSSFTVWWGRNTAGLLLVATLGLLLLAPLSGWTDRADLGARLRRTLLPPTHRETVEGLLITAGSVVLYAVVFLAADRQPLAFLLLFTVVLAGIRLRPLGVTLHGLLTGTLAIVFTLAGHGPLAAVESVVGQALIAQVFVCMTVVTGLMLAFSRQERDDAMAALRDSERVVAERADLFGAVLEHLREGIAVVDPDGTVVARNPAGRRLVGLDGTPTDEVLPSEVYGLFHPGGRPVAEAEMPFRRALAGEEVLAEDLVVRGPALTGDRILEITAMPMRDPATGEVRQAVVNFRDVTADREDRDALASFAGVVAHDLFTPLTLVNGWADSLDEAFDEGEVTPEDGKAMVARIQSAGRQMSAFIDDLLSYTLSRDASVTLEPVDLSAVAEEIARLRRQGDTRPRIVVQPGMRAAADPVLVRQLLDNLIGNAVKYVAPEVRPMVRITAERHGKWLEVTVRDNGIGVPPDQRERIFANFYRAHQDGYRGTGIGLAICRRVVERHGGTISVSSHAVGHGSAFTFTLPLHVAPPERRAPVADPEDSTASLG